MQSKSGKGVSSVRYIVAIAAGKGGVGKSSISVGLALALQSLGYSVGVLDADLYGPSIGRMLPLDCPIGRTPEGDFLIPGEFQGLKAFSIAHLKEEGEAMIVRAPIVNGLILQCVKDVDWGELDYLFVDFPPGTGDIQLTLMQEMSFFAAILVTTPQEIAVLDVRKAAQMFHYMGVPILGVIENMAYFEDMITGKRHALFGEGGGERLAASLGIPLLEQVPIDPNLCLSGDEGKNIIKDFSNTPAARHLHNAAKEVSNRLFMLEELAGDYLKEFALVWEDMD